MEMGVFCEMHPPLCWNVAGVIMEKSSIYIDPPPFNNNKIY